MTELNVVLKCSRLPWKKRSNFNARERSVFEITPADLSSCDLLPIYICTLGRLRNRRRREGRERLAQSGWALVWAQSVGEGPFDCIAMISVTIVFAPVFEDWFYEGRIICIKRIKLQRWFSLRSGREFSSVASRDFYNTFVLVRDSGLCLFAEKSLQRINQNLAETNCIKASGS